PHEDNGEVQVIKLDRLIPVRGRATFADGQPAPGIKIDASGSGPSRNGSHGGGSRKQAETDENGHYELLVPPYQGYVVAVEDAKWGAQQRSGFAVMPGPAIEEIDFVLRPATRLFGRVTVGPDEKPAPRQQMRLWLK